MIALANRLISESINQSDPIDPPVRTVSKDSFVAEYMAHSAALVEFLDNPPSDESLPPLDDELREARNALAESLARLEVKLGKLSDLRFWMDNMIIEQNSTSK
jgi:hypothetical protein